ncbi:O-antigen ligase family protein [Photobacterium leiognathi]|uniref:O-antigen ligase family protein n=1 Tax=Photobacterium leiognathi TaxID=553611 RepID=UPI00020884DA|nr:O-antigen ligase family protein [Photobacterium leiognathi]PSW53763.1 hypothetical protein CTM83_08185 [Photobacterium leiognathi subsp. mandapamensis]GAA04680.1 putative membrane protein [Photobacterium leiognathi subsp. mandapamensis svers.1.1.]
MLSFKVNDIIYSIIICFYLFFDSINGFFIGTMGIHLPISISIKLFILVLSLAVIIKSKSKITVLIGLIIIFIFPIIIRGLFYSQDYLFVEFNYTIKYVAFLLFIYYFQDYYSENKRCYDLFYRMIYISYIVVVLNISLGFVGVGGYTYPSTNTGYKGFFIAGNELSAVFILSTILIYGQLFYNCKFFVSFIFIIFSISISIYLGTKSSVLILALTFFIYPLYTKVIQGQLFYLIKSILILFIPMLLTLFFIYHMSGNIQEIPTIERILLKFDNNYMIHAVFSGREIWFNMYVNYIHEHYSNFLVYLSMIFGPGFDFSVKATLGKLLIESDLVDLFTLSGVIGITVILCIAGYFAYVIYSSRANVKFWKEALYVHVILTLIAIFFGHVWTSGMLSIAYAAMIGFFFSQRIVKC